MGCDIHFHSEVKINGKWEHYSNPTISRNYKLFTLLAGVRNYSADRKWLYPFREADGEYPEDLNVVTQKALVDNEDAHSIITYNSKQIQEFYKYLRDKNVTLENSRGREESLYLCIEHDYLGYLYGNDWDILNYPEDKPEYVEDVRWVMGFDN